MRIKHPRLDKNDKGQLICICPSQTKTRNTESIYNMETQELFMGGTLIKEHPKFKSIDQFENWCNTYWAKH